LVVCSISSGFGEVVIVEEHQEVLPYWFEKADREGVRGATLLHIDGHNDMGEPGPPAHYDTAWPEAPFTKERLFAANDEFIVYAILRGLIDRVVWVQPEYSTKHRGSLGSNSNSFHSVGFVDVGLLKRSAKRGRTKMACSCQFLRPILPRKLSMKPPECEDASGERIDYGECLIVKRVRYEEISPEAARDTGLFASDLMDTRIPDEHAAGEVYPAPLPDPDPPSEEALSSSAGGAGKAKARSGVAAAVILDIDEDYFGTESPATNLHHQGWNERDMALLQSALRRHFCVRDTKAEAWLNRALSASIRGLAPGEGEKVQPPGSLGGAGKEPEGRVLCRGASGSWEDGIEEVTQIARVAISGSATDSGAGMIESLLRYGFCAAAESFAKASMRGRLATTGVPMGVCIGNSVAGEEDGQRVIFHTPTPTELQSRMGEMQGLLGQVRHPIWLTTICRSSRDGYTPRHLQIVIEAGIINAIEANTAPEKLQLVYDPDLFMGHRHHQLDEGTEGGTEGGPA